MALQSSLWEATLEELEARTEKMAEIQEQLVAKDAELSGLLSRIGEPVDELRQIKT